MDSSEEDPLEPNKKQSTDPTPYFASFMKNVMKQDDGENQLPMNVQNVYLVEQTVGGGWGAVYDGNQLPVDVQSVCREKNAVVDRSIQPVYDETIKTIVGSQKEAVYDVINYFPPEHQCIG